MQSKPSSRVGLIPTQFQGDDNGPFEKLRSIWAARLCATARARKSPTYASTFTIMGTIGGPGHEFKNQVRNEVICHPMVSNAGRHKSRKSAARDSIRVERSQRCQEVSDAHACKEEKTTPMTFLAGRGSAGNEGRSAAESVWRPHRSVDKFHDKTE